MDCKQSQTWAQSVHKRKKENTTSCSSTTMEIWQSVSYTSDQLSNKIDWNDFNRGVFWPVQELQCRTNSRAQQLLNIERISIADNHLSAISNFPQTWKAIGKEEHRHSLNIAARQIRTTQSHTQSFQSVLESTKSSRDLHALADNKRG